MEEQMPRIHYVMAVWGARYCRTLIDIVLPTLLSPGNLPACRHRATSVFKFQTLPEDAAWLAGQPLVARLRELIEVEFDVIHPEDRACVTQESAYYAMSVFHRHAIRRAIPENAYMVFMTADAIVSDGSFRTLERYAEQGADCVVLCGVRCLLDDARPELLAALEAGQGLSARWMTDLLLRHPHPLAQAMTWGAPVFNSGFPGHLYWFGENGILAHGWHLHPWMIRATPGTDDFLSTIDADYVAKAHEAGLKIHTVQDSDEVCVVELSPRGHLAEVLLKEGPMDVPRVLNWAAQCCKPVHRAFFRQPIVFKGTACRDDEIAKLEAEAAPAVADLADRIENAIDARRELRDLAELREYPAVHIYGAGHYGRTIRALTREAGIDNIAGFIDSERDGELDGDRVRSLATFKAERGPGDAVLICSQYMPEILERLEPLRPIPILAAVELFMAYGKRHLKSARVASWTGEAPVGEDAAAEKETR